MFVRELGVKHLEVWSQHLESPVLSRCRALARAASQAGARVINIQLDQREYEVRSKTGSILKGRFNLSDSDHIERQRSVRFAKDWMDAAAECGAGSLRVNTGKTGGKSFDMNLTTESLRQLAEHGQRIGVKVLVENHGPNVDRPERLAELVRRVDHHGCRTLPDFGNVPKTADESFREQMLQALVPAAHLVSAKTKAFDSEGNHTTYDFARCVQLCEQLGYQGIYSAEYWNPSPDSFDPISVARKTLRMIADNLVEPS
ncbi:sugar phosphate isomerase/epimerase family protein [Crateriforma conspicua]|uniref:sugar phosphate isomerase/epimerase family protein n=1 Tax=Crateriforma conspicua TaxID=2527996 RepID=UPI001E348F60|nr:sugar phosphate isomerase/epimerase family protein [Crateriforma conspicua]